MIKRLTDILTLRQQVRIILLLAVLVSFLVLDRLMLPAWDEMRAKQDTSEASVRKHARLGRNLLAARQIEGLIGRQQRVSEQVKSDEITQSEFLRDLEATSRLPRLRIVNIKPFSAQDTGTHRIYRVKLSVAGPLQEVLQFVASVMAGPNPTGLDSFSIRGVQGKGIVESTLTIASIRLIPNGDQGKRASTARVRN